MARIDNLTNFLTDVANSIREKKGTTGTILAKNFDTEIASIETGGSGTLNLQDKNITITSNGTQNVTADEGYDGIDTVTLSVQVPQEVSGYIEDCSKLFNKDSKASHSLITKLLPHCKPTNAYKMFFNNLNVSGTFDVTNLDVSQCTTFESMFEGMLSVTSFNVSNFNTSACTNMQSMFIYFGQTNPNANKLDLSSFNTTNVTNMGYMFWGGEYIAEIDLSSFDFTNVTNFSSMFTNCGISCLASAGAYADGIPYIYVKDETAQNWILTKSNGRPSTWSTANVIIKEV